MWFCFSRRTSCSEKEAFGVEGTALTDDFLCALMRSLDVAVVAIELIVPTEVSDSFEPDRDRRVLREDGDSVTLAIGTKMPHLAGQSKYLTPSTDPSFLPLASSSWTPHQVPLAN